MKSIPADLAWLNLPNLPTPVKVLFSGYLLAIGLGLCMAGLQIMLTHGMADGKPGLSLDDIVYSYYGNRSGSKLESMLNGSMKEMVLGRGVSVGLCATERALRKRTAQ